MRVVAYMLTWTIYGTWLQGDRRGWVKNGQILGQNSTLENSNRLRMGAKQTTLTKQQRKLTVKSIINEAKELSQKLFGVAVCKNHIHLVVQNTNIPIGKVVRHYKNAVRLALQNQGFQGKLWTGGFDKRYCMNDKELASKIAYIRSHIKTSAEVIINNS